MMTFSSDDFIWKGDIGASISEFVPISLKGFLVHSKKTGQEMTFAEAKELKSNRFRKYYISLDEKRIIIVIHTTLSNHYRSLSIRLTKKWK